MAEYNNKNVRLTPIDLPSPIDTSKVSSSLSTKPHSQSEDLDNDQSDRLSISSINTTGSDLNTVVAEEVEQEINEILITNLLETAELNAKLNQNNKNSTSNSSNSSFFSFLNPFKSSKPSNVYANDDGGTCLTILPTSNSPYGQSKPLSSKLINDSPNGLYGQPNPHYVSKSPDYYDDTEHVRAPSLVLQRNLVFKSPWSPQIYFTTRGAENLHIYLWLAKDLSWTQDWVVSGMLFGALAIAWTAVLFYLAISDKNWEEAYTLVPYALWLIANYYWMTGELINGDDDIVGPRTSYIMIAALGISLIYYFILLPLNVFDEHPSRTTMTKRPVESTRASLTQTNIGVTSMALNENVVQLDLVPRFSFFKTWRDYENFHVVCWIAKDMAWARVSVWMWLIFLFPALFVSTDFVYMTILKKEYLIDSMHYLSQWFWVLGCTAWAMGQVLSIPGELDDDIAIDWFKFNNTSVKQCRWWGSLLILIGWLPIIGLYMVWLPLTYFNAVKVKLPNINFDEIPDAEQIITENFNPNFKPSFAENTSFSSNPIHDDKSKSNPPEAPPSDYSPSVLIRKFIRQRRKERNSITSPV